MIVVLCEKCRQPFRIREEQRTERIACPRCGQAQIPASSGSSPGEPAPPPGNDAPPQGGSAIEITVADPRRTALPPPPKSPKPAVVSSSESPPAAGFPSISLTTEPSSARSLSPLRRKSSKLSAAATVCLAVLLLGVGGALFVLLGRTPDPPVLAPVGDVAGVEQQPLEVSLDSKAADGELQFTLLEGPEGVLVDPQSGIVRWTPHESHGGGRHRIEVKAALAERPDVFSTVAFHVDVQEANRPPVLAPVPAQQLAVGDELIIALQGADPDQPANAVRYRLLGDSPPGATIDERSGRFTWKATADDEGQSRQVVIEVEEVGAEGLKTTVSFPIHVRAKRAPADSIASATAAAAPAGDAMPQTTTPLAASPTPTTPAATNISTGPSTPLPEQPSPAPQETAANGLAGFTQEEADQILKLHSEKQLFKPAAYPALRKLFADRFAREHATEIEKAFGGADSDMRKWAADHEPLIEELYLAIDPKHDKIGSALALFRQLVDRYPRQLADYGALGIAVAVTWDDPQAIYDYEQHRERAKATSSGGQLDGLGNFEYFLKAEGVMQGRARFLPWEFLVHVVNHRTPLAERQWAVANYLLDRTMIGRCYSDCPYDMLMLNTESNAARLNGQAYTLPNLRGLGGVCAHQADYASRVSQSLGVPAAYVRGESNSGEHHAWVMWVELKAVSAASIAFSLESHGRYRIDNYYVGELVDPQTGETTTDRSLELRLHTIGVNYLARRQAELLMQCFPLIRDAKQSPPAAQLDYLASVIENCPGCESAWFTLARLCQAPEAKKELGRRLQVILEQMFVVFAAFPDFTWRIFDDMIAFQDKLPERIRLYERLVAHYESQKRPDLACEARLRLTDLLREDKKDLAAIEGLAYSIKKFPDEGRHVPRMLDKLEEICGQVDGAGKHLTAFYHSFLPLIPPKRGDRPSQYCINMYQRGIDRFTEHGQPQLAQLYLLQLNAIRNGQAR